MQNLLKNYVQPIIKHTDLSDLTGVDIIEIRNLNSKDNSLIVEFNPESANLTVPFSTLNNDSLENYPQSFSVCLQKLDLDCNSGQRSTSVLSIDSTKKYEIKINGITTILYGDALLSYLQSLPDIDVVVQ